MATTLMSEKGESPQRSGGDEDIDPILGDGAAKAGMVVGMLSTGKAVAIDGKSSNAGISFIGIMDRSLTIDYDTAITDALSNNVMRPKSGRKYTVFIVDANATVLKGAPLTWGTTAGSVMVIKATATADSDGTLNKIKVIDDTVDVDSEPIIAYLDQDIITGDEVANIIWA